MTEAGRTLKTAEEIGLIAPHRGMLKELLVDPEQAEELRQEAIHLPSWDLTPRQTCDIELLLNGAFSPLEGFMGQADYEIVSQRMRLADDTLWPILITLDVTEEFASSIAKEERIALRHPEGMVLAKPRQPSARLKRFQAASCSCPWMTNTVNGPMFLS